MRIADYQKGRDAKFKVSASPKPNASPLKAGAGGFDVRDLPTIHFAVEFDIPEKKLKEAEQTLAVIKVPEESVAIAADVSYPEEESGE